MPNNTQKGIEGEEIATAHLLKMGYEILEKNWRHQHLEIDIIASINKTLVIVEVKLRANAFFGNPEEFVTSSKQKKLIRAADFYIKEKANAQNKKIKIKEKTSLQNIMQKNYELRCETLKQNGWFDKLEI